MSVFKHEVFRAEYLAIDYYIGPANNDRLMFTFTEAGNRQTDGFGFGGKFALEHGFDVIAFKSNTDNWYQETVDCHLINIDGILKLFGSKYSWKCTYGSSMGGYAALKLAKRLGANAALALSPQFDITADWDVRWSVQGNSLKKMDTFRSDDVSFECIYTIVYDPYDSDKLHYEKYMAEIPKDRLIGLRTPFAGHPVGYYLSHAGNLRDIALCALLGNNAHEHVLKSKKSRTSFADYFFNFAGYALKRGKLDCASRAIDKAISINKVNSEYHIRAALIDRELNKLESSISHAALAVALSPTHPHMLSILASVLSRKGFYNQALFYIDAAIAIIPQSESFRAQRQALLAKIG